MFSHKILMCAPDHFEVSYKINPWMDPSDKTKSVDRDEAIRQWTKLHHTIIRLGGYVEYVAPKPGLPDLVFTANAGFFHKNKVLLSNFRHAERRGEVDHYDAAFRRLGYTVHTTGKDFEGAGDAFAVADTLFLGHGFRTDRAVGMEIMEHFGLRKLVLCDLIDPRFYHLDTCFCPLGPERMAMFYPGAFSPESVAAMNSTGVKMLAVDEDEAERFACNAVVLPPNAYTGGAKSSVILPTDCPKTEKMLQSAGYATHAVPMTQFLKSGGACKCLTLQLAEHR